MKKFFVIIFITFICMTFLTSCDMLTKVFNDNNESEKEKIETSKYITNADYMHLSFDDVSKCFYNLSIKNYSSLFEEPFFAKLKNLHINYGAKFSLYTYNNVLNNVSNKYATDFSNNSDWLKIGLHSNSNGLSLANASYEQGMSYWNNFVFNILRICGTTDCIDRLPRLEYFNGSHQALFGMRDANCGALGFLSADDNRLSYYFDKNVTSYLYDHDYIKDETNDILFLSTDIRADWFYDFTTNNLFKAPIKSNMFEELEYRNNNDTFENSFNSLIIFAHEWLVYDGESINAKFDAMTDACQFAKKYNLEFNFAQNKSYVNTNADALFDSVDTSLPDVVLASRGLNIVHSINELKFTVCALTSSGTLDEKISGRATDKNNVLGGVSGKTINLTTKTLENNPLSYSLVEFKADGLINFNGQTAQSWLTSSIKLQNDTEYVMIAFRNGDGKSNFSYSALSLLPNCLTIN